MFASESMNTSTLPILGQLSALGDETRARLLSLLEGGELTVSELCAVLQLPQPSVSRHLKTLSEAGWVRSRADGRNRHYRMADSLDRASRELWGLVREGLDREPVGVRDRERARAVLQERRRRSVAFFAAAADRWDELRIELYGRGADLIPLFAVLDPSWVVGDLGAGTGTLAERLAPFVRSVVAVDRSGPMLDTARARLRGIDNTEVRLGELEALPVEDGALDLAILSLVLHHVVDPKAALSEAFRVLRPAGRVLVVELREHERGAEYAKSMGHVWPGFGPETMSEWMTAAGFAHVHVRPVPPDLEASGPSLFVATGSKSRARAART
jgi:SAM-dependent methyltransferase